MKETLLSRESFRSEVLTRDKHTCVYCGDKATAVHHIMERRLFDNGGYYLNNGASLCDIHHWEAEATLLSCEELRILANIKVVVLPDHLVADANWTKWGDELLSDTARAPGELFYDSGVQKILKEAGLLWQYGVYSRFPRTYHFPWSKGQGKEDRTFPTDTGFLQKEVVVTEKMDGECTSIYSDGYVHARSVDSKSHPSQSRIRSLANQIAWNLPKGWRICGENMQAIHSIKYTKLPAYFLVYALIDDKGKVLSWEDTLLWCQKLSLSTVPVLYRGIYSTASIKACEQKESHCGGLQEGYVVRPADSIPFSQYTKEVGKFVRVNHIQTADHHWEKGNFKENQLDKTMGLPAS